MHECFLVICTPRLHLNDFLICKAKYCEMARRTNSQHLLVASIDFGTTFCGYAFSMKSSPEQIVMNKNWGAATGFLVNDFHTCCVYRINPFYYFVQTNAYALTVCLSDPTHVI